MRSLYKYLFPALMAMILTACGNDTPGSSLPTDRTQKVIFTLAMDTPVNARSRATWGEDYDKTDATAYDNHIAPDALRVQILTADNTPVGDVADLVWWAVDEAGAQYRFMGDISHLTLTPNATYKIAVLANAAATAEWANATYTLNSITYPDGTIPMWGVKTAVLTLAGNQDIGTIDLLRAAAKVQVVLSDELIAAGYTLSSVCLKNYRDAGYVLPDGHAVATSTADVPAASAAATADNTGTGIEQENCIRETGTLASSALDFALLGTEVSSVSYDNTSSLLYIPEYANSTAAAHSAISVGVNIPGKDGGAAVLKTFEDAIFFCDYTDGVLSGTTHSDIVRNHCYRFEIIGVQQGAIMLRYYVLDWEDAEKYTYELGYPNYINPLYPDAYDRGMEASGFTAFPSPVMHYDVNNPEAGAFSCWFKLMSPAGLKWTPTVNRPSAEYEIKVYKETYNNGALVSTEAITDPANRVADSNAWYNIKVIPLGEVDADRKVSLSVTYEAASLLNSNTPLYFEINGDNGATVWPDSGSDPNVIVITHNANE